MQQRITKFLRWRNRAINIASILCCLFFVHLVSIMLLLRSAAAVNAVEDDITPTASNSFDATATLALGGVDQDTQVRAGFGETAYSNHTVTISADNITSYALTITGPEKINGSTEITGANSTTGSTLADNTWGYSYGETSDNSTKTYQSFTGTTKTLESKTTPTGNLASQTKDLIFAVRFGEDADPGRYYADVTVTLTATPLSVVGVWSTGLDSGITTLQAVESVPSGQFCKTSLPVGATIILTDNRDNKDYKIAKLDDGNCWMVQNLALDLYNRSLTTANSDVTSNRTGSSVASTTWTNSVGNSAVRYYNGSNVSGWTEQDGYYYTWCAATAGCNTSQSICPKGWKLPTNNQYAAFLSAANISTTDGWSKISQAPYSFTISGEMATTGFTGFKAEGSYWTSTAYDSGAGYNVGLRSTGYVANRADPKSNGYNVRCVASSAATEQTWDTMTTMQQMTPGICASAAIGATKTLTDTRDNNTYTIRKHEDGRCWMTQNLRLRGNSNNANPSGNALTSNDSDVSSNGYTLPATLTSLSANIFNSSYPNHQQSYYYSGYNNVYYSWQAATANSGSSATTAGTNAAHSICPKGWQLPTGGTSSTSDIQTLMSKAGITSSTAGLTKLLDTPYSFTAYRYFENGALQMSSSQKGGYYWTSTSSGNGNVYYLGYVDSYITMGNDGNYGNYFGYSVRCLARKSE